MFNRLFFSSFFSAAYSLYIFFSYNVDVIVDAESESLI
ncbi:hypothetical protein VTL71DRAFT_11652 [Oculimacula yallundae]|uniref:Uncharacterized protein n=1 Tax=Oculimacula yallundae TaxID=86028 RepID=A0ABR4CQS8_9HELO